MDVELETNLAGGEAEGTICVQYVLDLIICGNAKADIVGGHKKSDTRCALFFALYKRLAWDDAGRNATCGQSPSARVELS